jgi:hypothetical protein
MKTVDTVSSCCNGCKGPFHVWVEFYRDLTQRGTTIIEVKSDTPGVIRLNTPQHMTYYECEYYCKACFEALGIQGDYPWVMEVTYEQLS